MSTTKPRPPAQLRRDLRALLADLPRVLAQDMSAEMRREHERAGRRARLRLRWLSHMPDARTILALERNLQRRLKRGLGERS